MARSQPVSIEIPSLHVRSRLDTLGLDRNGEVQVPPIEADAPAGWYRGSSTPGEKGAAVILGHSTVGRYGTGVFYQLGELRAGQAALVHRADGTTAHFTVVRVAEYPKRDFPAREVYGDTADAELRLITCGNYDEAAHAYQDNVVVYAKLTASSTAD
ncbi:class F sortase [Streptomyces sp. TRM72054]|uniref:class F sortase n=1 Tax=Streptomyces sp. TRM72054 TaxID=2870562 RepID=UPI0021AB47CD|nr:class F sortase [Streptomyces sp. TRM72054]